MDRFVCNWLPGRVVRQTEEGGASLLYPPRDWYHGAFSYWVIINLLLPMQSTAMYCLLFGTCHIANNDDSLFVPSIDRINKDLACDLG